MDHHCILSQQERNDFFQQYNNFKTQGGQLWNWTNVVTVFDKITGYHFFRNMPLIGALMPLYLVREPDNRYDRHALKVLAVSLNEIDRELWDLETGRKIVREVAGKCIGRVPAYMSQIFSHGIETGNIQTIDAFYTGHLIQDGPVAGGGPKLSCVYFLQTRSEEACNEIVDALLDLPSAWCDV